MKIKYSLMLLAVLIMTATIPVSAATDSDIDTHPDCLHCGMDRKAFGYSRMLVQYEDGTSVGLCSLRCAAVELEANKTRKVKAVLVADRNSRVLIDAEKAVWVVGGRKKGVMTMNPKWAFELKASADAFIKEFGGASVTWPEALAAAKKELSQ